MDGNNWTSRNSSPNQPPDQRTQSKYVHRTSQILRVLQDAAGVTDEAGEDAKDGRTNAQRLETKATTT